MSIRAAEPQPVEDVQGDNRWMSMHTHFLRDAKEKEPEVLLIGDSLIRNMAHSPLWKKMFEPLHCLNFGVSGDRTEHVLWRVQNGELDQIEPKVIVLMVGTNNHGDTPEQVTAGIMAIVKAIQDKQPASNLIVVGLLPRGEHPNPLREKHTAINQQLAEQLSEHSMTTFLRIDDRDFFLPGPKGGDPVTAANGVIPRDFMYDFLHLTMDDGYQKLCEPLLEEIQNCLGTFVKVESTSFDTGSMAGDIANDIKQ
ncbi:platelet-activating factor acetylhydrolase ib subunit gamma-like [Plakobranchus ocellatus]|uniref:Platelet-activating factor acetylhydrolase ib subunit gamma-like n=1 Tax=Plakobranchus ocellatus TaxID=259542 RepID=A0AAV4CDT4_9GAST|nr:platelet-activating factor acetylhydrolase ib subunit gamma-like [Plakobranchus ocellatus]